MSRYRKRCRCGAELNEAGVCPHHCPPADARFRHNPVGRKPDDRPVGIIRAQVVAAARKLGVPEPDSFGCVSPKAVAAQRARRARHERS